MTSAGLRPKGATVVLFPDRGGVMREAAAATPTWPYGPGDPVTVRYDPARTGLVEIVDPLGFEVAFSVGCLAVGSVITAITWQAYVALRSL